MTYVVEPEKQIGELADSYGIADEVEAESPQMAIVLFFRAFCDELAKIGDDCYRNYAVEVDGRPYTVMAGAAGVRVSDGSTSNTESSSA